MEFILPGPENGKFTIPDEWWNESRMNSFNSNRSYYRPNKKIKGTEFVIISIDQIWGRERSPGVPEFRRDAMIKILSRIREDKSIDPIEIMKPTMENGYKYWLKDGFHRFRASVVAGYKRIPAIISFNPDIA